MIKSSDLQGLRAAPIYEAAGAEVRTARFWVTDNGLLLGDRGGRDQGHPRYDLADAARLLLVQMMVERLGMRPAAAVPLVNATSEQIKELAEIELRAIDDRSTAPACPRYIVEFQRADGETKPEISLYDASWHAGESGPILVTRIELRELVRSARDNLVAAIGADMSGLPNAFAEAA